MLFILFSFQCVLYEEKCQECRASDEVCDGIDNDLNGVIDDGFSDVDGDEVADCIDVESCDGVDNTGDGIVDEGFGDVDLDGIPDCLDLSCDLDESPQADGLNLSCSQNLGPISNPWQWFLHFNWPSSPEQFQNISMQPSVQNVDTDLQPEIIFVALDDTSTSGRLRIVDGQSLTLEDAFDLALNPYSDLLVVDTDGSGTFDYFVLNEDDSPMLIDAQGNIIWTSEPLALSIDLDAIPTHHTYATSGDLDGDGVLELIYGSHILDSTDGGVLGVLPPHNRTQAVVSVWEEEPVIFWGNGVYDRIGDEIFLSPLLGDFMWSAPIEVDGLLGTEWVHITENGAIVYNDSGLVVSEFMESGLEVGPPCVGNFDLDDTQEFATSVMLSEQRTVLQVWDPDTASVIVFDPVISSPTFACSVTDFNADGVDEIVWRSTEALYLLTGQATVLQMSLIESGLGLNYPLIADLDNDQSTDILLSQSSSPFSSSSGLQMFSHATQEWPPTTNYWSGHIHQTRSTEGTFPQFRGQPKSTAGAYDWTIKVLDSCASSCETTQSGEVLIQIQNRGFGMSPSQTATIVMDDGLTSLEVLITDIPPLFSAEMHQIPVEITGVYTQGSLLSVRLDNPDDCNTQDNDIEEFIRLCP